MLAKEPRTYLSWPKDPKLIYSGQRTQNLFKLAKGPRTYYLSWTQVLLFWPKEPRSYLSNFTKRTKNFKRFKNTIISGLDNARNINRSDLVDKKKLDGRR